jgi:hypothetical protein
MDDARPEFQYALAELPPARVPFRRWRWELWQGPRLVACGWRLSPKDAERGLRTAATRRVHELMGVRALRPERNRQLGEFAPGATVEVDCGAVTCVLAPRRDESQAAAA